MHVLKSLASTHLRYDMCVCAPMRCTNRCDPNSCGHAFSPLVECSIYMCPDRAPVWCTCVLQKVLLFFNKRDSWHLYLMEMAVAHKTAQATNDRKIVGKACINIALSETVAKVTALVETENPSVMHPWLGKGQLAPHITCLMPYSSKADVSTLPILKLGGASSAHFVKRIDSNPNQVHIYAHSYTHTHPNTYTHTHTYPNTSKLTSKYTHAHICAPPYPPTHTCARTRIRTHAHPLFTQGNWAG